MIKKIFSNRWVLFSLGFLFFSLFVWFIGPLFAFADMKPLAPVSVRLGLILLVLVIWIGRELFRHYQAHQASKRLLEGMATPDQSDVNAAVEVELLRKRVNHAVATLKKQGGSSKWGKGYLYEIPWYMFIGAPGSGKTTALVNCGLRFPVADGNQVHAIKGVGGTRNCDWWFSDDAIFLDTAGRYTTQDSDDKVDSRAWLGFLKLLKKARPRRPLNGVIVTLSMSDLLTQSESERDHYATTVRQRIQELREQLDMGFSIYLMITKTDLLAGFTEFFAQMGTEERSQVFGSTFLYSESLKSDFDFAAAFKKQFAETELRLNALLTERLQNERDMRQRVSLYTFPQQFSATGALIARFIEQAFGQSRYDQKMVLRGVYFTSGTQEGTPIDRVLGSLSRLLKVDSSIMLSPAHVVGKSYFLSKLLKEVLFPESELVSFDAKKQRIRTWLLRAGYVCIALFTLFWLAMWTMSYLNNQKLIDDANQKIAHLSAQSHKLPAPHLDDWQQIMPFVNQVRDLPYGYADREKAATLSFRFGLFQGERMGAMLENTYARTLSNVFLPRIALFLEEQIRKAPNNEVKYEALKAYLMLFDKEHLNQDQFIAFTSAAWERTYQLPSGDFIGHLRASLEYPAVNIVWQKDDALINETRTTLASASLAERIFSRMSLLGVPDDLKQVKLSDMMGPSGVQIFERQNGEPLSTPLNSFFTYEGYHKGFNPELPKMVKQMADEDVWVLGSNNSAQRSDADKAQLEDAVRRRYLAEYIREWEDILKSIQLKKSESITDTLMLARTLSATDSPLKKLLLALNKELSLSVTVENAVKEQATDSVLKSAKDMATKIVGGPQANALMPTKPKSVESIVDMQFAQLRQLAPNTTAAGQPMPIDQSLTILNDFYQELSSYNSAAGGLETKPLTTSVRLKAEADRLPAPVGTMLNSLVVVTTTQAGNVNKEKMQKAMGGAASFCEKAISGRYPANRGASSDMMLSDFNTVFAPGGELDAFFNTNLKNIVDTSSSVWKLQQGAVTTNPISQQTLSQFQNADSIRRAFFRGGNTAGVTAELKLISSDWPQITLEYNGETRQFAPGGSSYIVKWPTSNGTTVKLYAPAPAAVISAEGDWSIFHLVDKLSGESSGAADKIRLVYQSEGKKAVFELRAGSILNPFRLKELRAFQCPRAN